MIIGVIDLGINNLNSVIRAFSEPLLAEDKIFELDGKHRLSKADLIILPGLGKFEAGMKSITEKNLSNEINTFISSGAKIVGICLGMHLLGSKSAESPGIEGLNLIRADIQELLFQEKEKSPHMGWASTKKVSSSNHFNSLSSPGDFYFAHSYRMIPFDEEHTLTTTEYGESEFVSSVFTENFLGLQFHPEKSGNKGKKLISEIVDWARIES